MSGDFGLQVTEYSTQNGLKIKALIISYKECPLRLCFITSLFNIFSSNKHLLLNVIISPIITFSVLHS